MTTISFRSSWQLLLLFVAVVMGVGFVVGLISAPSESWIAQMTMPPVLVPDWVSGVLWFLLAVAFAVAGWRLWLLDSASVETRLWLAILILSWWYQPLFVVARVPLAALIVIALLTVLMVIFIYRAWNTDRVSALLFVPCALWVGYATVLTGWIISLNPDVAGT